DHVLTRTFYLLTDFPGRFAGQPVWVEASPPDAERAEGMPLRHLNDGVTPVVIGGNDWARAWAVDDRGIAMFPVRRGFAGARRRACRGPGHPARRRARRGHAVSQPRRRGDAGGDRRQ